MTTERLTPAKAEKIGSVISATLSTVDALSTLMPNEENITPEDTRSYDNGGCLVVAEAILLFLSREHPELPAAIHGVRHGRRVHFVTAVGQTAFEWSGARPLSEVAKAWGGKRTPARIRPTTAARANLSVYRDEEVSEKLAEMMQNFLSFRKAAARAWKKLS